MIIEIGLGYLAQKKIAILNHLKTVKQTNPNYRIIDIGGGKEKHVLDKFEFIDACADMREVKHENITHFRGNINDPSLWKSIEDDVTLNGKYDFCICTHTLEDIAAPAYVASQISSISKQGLVTFPSKYRECSRFELNGLIRGYSHHRWILTIKDNAILAFPKVNLIEDPFFDKIAEKSKESNNEVYLLWKDEINFNIINSDWLGPNPPACLQMYKDELLLTQEDRLL